MHQAPCCGSDRPLVALSQSPHPEVLRLLRRYRIAVPRGAAKQPQWPAEISEASALLVFMSDRVDDELLKQCPELQIVAGALKGGDRIDVSACTAREIWVTVVPEILSPPTAEIAVALLLAAARRLREGDALIRAGQFDGWRRQLEGFSLRNAPVGIVGAGSVGRQTIAVLTALGSQCAYYDPAVTSVPDARPLPLDELLRRSRAVVVALPLKPGTSGFLSSDRIGVMPSGSILVNVGRGSTVDESAVAEALAVDHLAAYAADVFAMEDGRLGEQPGYIHPGLLAHPRSVYTPHLGTACPEARGAIEAAAAQSILQALEGKSPDGAVNRPSKVANAAC
jgi:phosphonate dehydrogenase